MSDIRDAEGNDGNSGFSDEWKKLAAGDEGQGGGSPDDDGSEATPAETATEAAPQEPAPSEITNDIWAEAPASLREAYEAERKARERAENAIRSNNGRLSKAEREAAELRVRLAAQAPTQREEAPQAGEADDKPTDDLSRVKEEYSDVAGPLVDEIVKLRGQMTDLYQARASQEEQAKVAEELRFKEYLAAQEQMLSDTHGDWQEVVMKPEFVEWVQTGPQFIRDGIARNGNGIVDGAEAAQILSMFKDSGGTVTPNPLANKRERQLEGARNVPGTTPGVTPQGASDDFKSEWKRLNAIENQRRSRQLSAR